MIQRLQTNLKTLKVLDGAYLFASFLEHDVIAGFSDRRWNFSSEVTQKRERLVAEKSFCKLLALGNLPLKYIEQVHGSNILLVENSNQATANVEADAVITTMRKVPIAIRTADCAPLFFFDTVHRAMGIAHIGWQGAEQGLVQKVVGEFQRQFQSRPEDFLVALGPVIRAESYEVGKEFIPRFRVFVNERDGKYFFDLPGLIRTELISTGISASALSDCGFCTVRDSAHFHSYRREGVQSGRMASVMMLK